jgi:hypothetical protein
VFTGEFERTGFRGGLNLNWYRNIDRLWELTPPLRGPRDASQRCVSQARSTR